LRVIGRHVIHKKICRDSSMDWARELFYDLDDGTVLLADEYKVARGREGREWRLYKGQLIVTFVLKPKLSSERDADRSLKYLNMAITVGIYDVLREYGVRIKEPNDFMLDIKKVGGVLIEVVWLGGVVQGVIVGVAINCNNKFDKSDDLYDIATSLSMSLKRDVSMDLLQKNLFISVDKWYNLWISGECEEIFSAWNIGQRAVCHCLF